MALQIVLSCVGKVSEIAERGGLFLGTNKIESCRVGIGSMCWNCIMQSLCNERELTSATKKQVWLLCCSNDQTWLSSLACVGWSVQQWS